MADGTRESEERGSRQADDADLSARLQRLGERLDHVDASRPARTDPAPRSTADSSALARGFRLSTELVAGALVGAVLGWWFAFTRDLRRERTFTIDDMPVATGPYGVSQPAPGETAAPRGPAGR